MDKKTGVLLVNLGTPDSFHPKDVQRYLVEFLTDGRVIDVPWLWRQILVRGFIIPRRYKQSAACYAKIWTSEGSPLSVYSRNVKDKLQTSLGTEFYVELAMRYRKPSIEETLTNLLRKSLQELIIFPLFPQYASATSGSVHQKVMELLKNFQVIPHVTFVNSFFDHPAFVEAFCARGASYAHEEYDHILFSYHGLPKRHVMKADRHAWCLQEKECCEKLGRKNETCYAAQCFATTQAIASKLNIPRERYSLCFQSRLGKDPWLQPYASETIKDLAKKGKKKILVFCPSFVCDCLETIYEFGVEYAAEFKHAGGELLELVRGLNDSEEWIKALHIMIKEKSSCFKINKMLKFN